MSKITIDRELLEQAIEWFEWFRSRPMGAIVLSSTQVANMLREALAQPQPVPPEGPMAETVEQAARDVAKCLNERDGQGLDLRHVAMLANYAQQPVQEPVARVKFSDDAFDSVDWIPYQGQPLKDGDLLFTSPQAQPLSDEQEAVLNFLLGASDLDGAWFGDQPPKENGSFWWRDKLRKAFQADRAITKGKT